jgi:hypothetical protein
VFTPGAGAAILLLPQLPASEWGIVRGRRDSPTASLSGVRARNVLLQKHKDQDCHTARTKAHAEEM